MKKYGKFSKKSNLKTGWRKWRMVSWHLWLRVPAYSLLVKSNWSVSQELCFWEPRSLCWTKPQRMSIYRLITSSNPSCENNSWTATLPLCLSLLTDWQQWLILIEFSSCQKVPVWSTTTPLICWQKIMRINASQETMATLQKWSSLLAVNQLKVCLTSQKRSSCKANRLDWSN